MCHYLRRAVMFLYVTNIVMVQTLMTEGNIFRFNVEMVPVSKLNLNKNKLKLMVYKSDAINFDCVIHHATNFMKHKVTTFDQSISKYC